jgi:hypothetical protein
MAKQLKIYTTGSRHFVSPEVSQALGLPPHRHQAEVFVAAYTKAEAFRYLTEVKLAPMTVNNADFRVASGRTVDALVAADALPKAGAIAAVGQHGMNTPAVWVSGDGHGCVQFGEFVRGEFIPDADLVAGGGLTGKPLDAGAAVVPDDASALAGPVAPASEPHPLGCGCGCDADGFTDGSRAGSPREVAEEVDALAARADDEEVQMVRSMLFSSTGQIRQLEDELGRRRKARGDLVLRALALEISVEDIAGEMGVGASRVYQLRYRALRERAEGGEFLPGLIVQVELRDRAPSRYPVGTVVEQPADRLTPDESGDWVWVCDRDNGSVYPVRRHRVLATPPSCSICEPAVAPYGLTTAQLSVHQVSKHGVS